ncbi:MAG: DUF6600 domain-containing protein [Sandaracinobacter sp.]
MKQFFAIAGLGLALMGCMTDYGWSEAPLDDRHYAQGIPVDWWGRDVGSVDIFYGSLAQYGTWGTHSRFGWFWVPDTRFGPSWVDWRAGGGFASWSPLPPVGWSNWGYGWGNDWWVHAPGAWVYRPGLRSHVLRGRHDWAGRNWDGRNWDVRDRDRDWDRDWDLDWDRDRDRATVDRSRPGESPMACFVRNRVRPGGAPGLQRLPMQAMAPPRAMPAEARVAAPPPPRAERVERAEPSYRAPAERSGRSYEGNRGSGWRDVPQRVADD